MIKDKSQMEFESKKSGRRKMKTSEDSSRIEGQSKQKLDEAPCPDVEALLTSKIAELESIMKKKATTGSNNYDKIPSLNEISIDIDDPEKFCRQFDTELKDENKLLFERISTLRKMYVEQIEKIHHLRQIDNEESSAYSKLIADCNDIRSSILRCSSEKDACGEVKTKLKDLCRLLQKQTKVIAEENDRILTGEQRRLEELELKFRTTLFDINQKLEEHEAEHLKQVQENESLKEKLQQLEDHIVLKKDHYATQVRTKSLEQQLVDAKTEQLRNMICQERDNYETCKSHIAKMEESEQELQSQVTLYGNKFKSFDDAVRKSEDVFVQFESKIEKMNQIAAKYEKKNARLVRSIAKHREQQVVEQSELEVQRSELSNLQNIRAGLENSCRQLQKERSMLSNSSRSGSGISPNRVETKALESGVQEHEEFESRSEPATSCVDEKKKENCDGHVPKLTNADFAGAATI